MDDRQRLKRAAVGIAARYDKPSAGSLKAMSKLLVAPRWAAPDIRARGIRRWKRGEVLEWFFASTRDDRREEWGDVGYYVAQTWPWLWRLYAAVTPGGIITAAVRKFERRAATQRRVQ